jgi:hypothetical protein
MKLSRLGTGADLPGFVMASEAKQSRVTSQVWIASSWSLSSGAHSRDPVAARNDDL